jgi:hypothetical protein
VFSTGVRAPETEPKIEPSQVPEAIVKEMHTLYAWRQGEFSTSNLNNKNFDPKPDQRPWADDAALTAYMDFAGSIERRMDSDVGLAYFLGRSAEIAVRLATIRAAGRSVGNYDFNIDLSDIRWGIDLASASGNILTIEAREKMNDEMSFGQIVGKVIETIKKHRRISRSALLRTLQKSVRSKELNDILRTLVESRTISIEIVHSPKGGPSATWYKIILP